MGWQDAPPVSGWQSAPRVEEFPTKPPADAKARTLNAFAGGNKGVTALLGLPVDTGENLINLGLTGYGALKNLLTGKNDSPKVLQGSFGGSQYLQSLANKGGIQTENANPEDMPSRMLHTGMQIAGGSMLPGAKPFPTAMAAAGGAAASEIDPRLTALGTIAPGAMAAGATATRQALAQGANANLKMFQRAGVAPTVGMTTDSSFFAGLENLLAKFPGSQGLMQKTREGIQSALSQKTKTGVSAEAAGRAIEKGITGKGGFLEETQAAWQKLDDAVAAKVPKGTSVIPSETQAALDELTAPIQGAEKTTGGLVNPKLAQLKADLTDDLAANNGRLPFEALRALRTRVGSMLENAIVSGVQKGELKRLYGALSKDLGTAAAAGGAGREFARQNAYYTARQGRIERTLEKVLGDDKHPEDIFKAFYPADSTQFSKASQTIRSLPAAERKVVTNAVVDRLGRATPGKQNEMGDVFSSETFLTNWNKLSPKAKSVLFPDQKMRADLEAVAAASSKIRHGNSAFANPSGTAGSFAAYSIYSSPAVSLATGSPIPMVAAAASAGGANITARMLTNPKVIAWMAGAPNGNPKAMIPHMARLAEIYKASDDEALKSDLSDYIKTMNGDTNGLVR